MGGIVGRGKIKMASASTLSLNKPARASPHRKAKANEYEEVLDYDNYYYE